MWAYRLLYIFRSTRQNIQDHSTTLAMSITAVGFTLILFAAYVLLISNLESMGKRLGEHLQITLYLDKKLASEKADQTGSRVQNMEEVESVTFRSTEQAMELLKKSLGRSAGTLAGLSGNPLPASFEVRLKEPYRNLDALRDVASRLKKLDGVREADYGGDWVVRFFGFLGMVYWLGASLGILLLAATVIVISSTLSLGFYARKEEIEILRLVGASESYVRFPFFWEAMIQGVGGALLAVGILWILYQVFRLKVLDAWTMFGGWVPFHFLSPLGVLGIVLLGAAVGVLSCIVSFSRFYPRP